MERVVLIDEVLNIAERALNLGSNRGDAPPYQHEGQKAPLDLITKQETGSA